MITLPRDSILSRHQWRAGELLWLVAAVACYFVFPEYLALGTSVLVMVLLVLSFDLLLGFSGVLSLGHGAAGCPSHQRVCHRQLQLRAGHRGTGGLIAPHRPARIRAGQDQWR